MKVGATGVYRPSADETRIVAAHMFNKPCWICRSRSRITLCARARAGRLLSWFQHVIRHKYILNLKQVISLRAVSLANIHRENKLFKPSSIYYPTRED